VSASRSLQHLTDLTERPCGYFDTSDRSTVVNVVLRVTRRAKNRNVEAARDFPALDVHAANRAKLVQLLERELRVAAQIQHRVEQRARMSVRQNEAIAIDLVRVRM
jgi:hypothetical protein